MSVRPIDFNGMIQNTQEVSASRSQDEHKPVVQQQMGALTLETQAEESTHQVHEQGDADAESALDPDNGGGASYSGRRKAKKKTEKKKARVSDGKVSVKSAHKAFDVTI